MYTVSLSESISWDLKPQYAASMKGVFSGDDVAALGLRMLNVQVMVLCSETLWFLEMVVKVLIFQLT